MSNTNTGTSWDKDREQPGPCQYNHEYEDEYKAEYKNEYKDEYKHGNKYEYKTGNK